MWLIVLIYIVWGVFYELFLLNYAKIRYNFSSTC